MIRNRLLFLTLTSILATGLALLTSCNQKTIVDQYNEKNVLLLGNTSEPQGLDLQRVTGVIESNIIRSMFEGLCSEHPSKEGVHEPGAAKSWSANDDFTEWTFKLQPSGKWSDGKPVTAEDFIFAYNRILHPQFGAKYASMLYFIKGAEDYNTNQRGKILLSADFDWNTIKEVNFRGNKTIDVKSLKERFFKNLTPEEQIQFVNGVGLDQLDKEQLSFLLSQPEHFHWPSNLDKEEKHTILDTLYKYADADLWSQANIGVSSLDPLTLKINLRASIPFLPDLTKHYTWFPIPKHVILKHGKIDDRRTAWTEPENIVGNGPFKLKDWQLDYYIEVDKNPYYWDKDTVSLNGIRYLPIGNLYTEARMFFNHQLHITSGLAPEMIDYSKKNYPDSIRQETYLACNFLRFNVTNEHLKNEDLRKALAYSIDAQSIIDNILKGGEKRATGIVPPMGEYQPADGIHFDPELAKKYLNDSGIDPATVKIVLLTTSKDQSKILAEAYQDMWKRYLGISIEIEAREWKTYLDRMSKLDYGVATGGWIGDYPDPTTFLDMWKKGDGNNRTGWSNKEYENTLTKAEIEKDAIQRVRLLEQAEQKFLSEMPIAPISWSNKNYLIDNAVKGWNPLLLNNHPFKHVKLKQK